MHRVQVGYDDPFVMRRAAALCQLAVALASSSPLETALADSDCQEEALVWLAAASGVMQQVMTAMHRHHAPKHRMKYVSEVRKGICSPQALLGVLRRLADACTSLRGPELSNDRARHALTVARTELFQVLHIVSSSFHGAKQLFQPEYEALQAPEEQRRFAALMVATLEDQLAGPPPAEGDPTAWADILYEALQAAELPLIRPGMHDTSPVAPGLCCPGRAQRLLEAALQALAASPLELPKSMPAAGHLGMMSTLVLVVCGLVDWALPQWAAAEAAGLADPPGCLFCGRTCDDGTCSSMLDGKQGQRSSGSNGATSGSRLPEAPARETLLTVLKAIPASAGVLIALLEQHQRILNKPKLFSDYPVEEYTPGRRMAWAAKACVRMGYIPRSRACTPSSWGRAQGACAWRTAEQPDGAADSSLAEASVAAAEALVRLSACIGDSEMVPHGGDVLNWETLPSKAFLYAELLLEPSLRPVRTGSLAPTPALQKSALGLAFSMAKAAMVLGPLAAPFLPMRHRLQASPFGRSVQPVTIDVLARVFSAVCFDTFFVLAPSMGRDEDEEEEEEQVFVPDEEARPTTAAALSLSFALGDVLPLLAAQGHDANEAEEAILGPMLAPLAVLHGGFGLPNELVADPDRATALRPCAYLGCTRLQGASEWDLPSQRCSGCNVTAFCSQECRQAAWPRHRIVCAALKAVQ